MNQPSANLKSWFSCLNVRYQIKCSFLNLRSLATYSATELIAHFLFHTLIHFPPQCWLTVSDLFSLFCLCVCREISVEKLNLEGTSPPKAEIRRDVVDAPAPLVSEWERERDGWMPKKRGSRGKDGHLKTIMLLFCSLPTWGFWLVNSAPVIGHCTVCCSEI